MPNRIIKESLLVSDSYASLSLEERDLFVRLIVSADDYGRFDARPAVVRGHMFPLEEVTQSQVAQWLKGLCRKGLITLYACEGREYLSIISWERHQKIRAKRSKYPPPPGEAADAQEPADACPQMSANVPVIQSESKSESESESQSQPGQLPSLQAVCSLCAAEGLAADPQAFWEYYQARDWCLGSQRIRDWRSILRRWSTSPGPPPKRLGQAHYQNERTYDIDDGALMDAFMADYIPGESE